MDSLHEIDRVAAMARKHGVVQGVMLRLTPGIQAHTHESISTAHEDVKFGFSIASGAAWAAVEATLAHPELELRGFHSHIGVRKTTEFGALTSKKSRLISLEAQQVDAAWDSIFLAVQCWNPVRVNNVATCFTKQNFRAYWDNKLA